MINTLALNLIASVMKWDNEVATKEYLWLRLMSAMKYDGYSDFRAGVRFLESLVPWLRQFDDEARIEVAFFLLRRLPEKGFVNENARSLALTRLEEMIHARRQELVRKHGR